MKILYAVQATGNGHIARAMEVIPYLQLYGKTDVFLSGDNNSLQLNLPVRYKSKGLSLQYGNNGNLNYKKIWNGINIRRIYKEAKHLPVEKYDVVINDFESITSLACRLKNIPSIHFGHQASFYSDKAPRPKKKDFMGELILKNYATATSYVGLHFKRYDKFIFNPIIKRQILQAHPNDNGYITIYLPHYADETIAAHVRKIKHMRFEIFSKKAKQKTIEENMTFIPMSTASFNESIINCTGIITGAGFETPSEALYLGKKVLCIPVKGQYEQLCNAAALKEFGVQLVPSIDEKFSMTVCSWMDQKNPVPLILTHSIDMVIEHVMQVAANTSIEKGPTVVSCLLS